jgi:hypothetical protein
MTVLAMTAGRTIVSMATTDAWDKFKQALSRVLGHGNGTDESAIDRRLQQSRDQLIGVAVDGRPEADSQQAAVWRMRIADLLEDYPDITPGLKALLAETADKVNLQVTKGDHNFIAGSNVHIMSSGTGIAAGVFNGNVNTANPQKPDPHQ